MKTYKARVAVTGTFYVNQTVEAESELDAIHKISDGLGENEGGCYDWDTWATESFQVMSNVEEVKE